MQLTEKEQSVIKELQTQEKSCVEKYRFYESSAKDPELQKLFHQIGDEEQEHFDSLADVLKGNVPGSLTLCLPLDFHNPLHYSPLRLIFLSNFCFFSVLFCTLVI